MEEVDAKYGSMVTLAQDMVFGKAISAVSPDIELYLFGDLS